MDGRLTGERGRGALSAGWGLALAACLTGCGSLHQLPTASDPVAQRVAYREDAARLRGLPFAREIAVERESREALLASLSAELDKPEERRFIDETERLLRHFRVLAPGVSLRELYLRLMGEQIAAYYDPVKKRVAYVDHPADLAQQDAALMTGHQAERFVYIHEFCHAAEDVRFDLDRLTRGSLSELDRNFALTSFAEGNAVLVGVDGLFRDYPVNTATPFGAFLISLGGCLDFSENLTGELTNAPAFLNGALLHPYLDGAVFCNRLRRESGWQAIDMAYRNRLPVTTAEIYYPERRYLRPFTPAVFEPKGDLFAGAGAAATSTNTLGVLATALWLGGDQVASVREFGFLKGWMGDRVYLGEGQNGAACTVWLSYWERPGFARAFCRHARRRLDGPSFEGLPSSVVRQGRCVAAVWGTGAAMTEAGCRVMAERALLARVKADTPSLATSWWTDTPWPVGFAWREHAVAFDVLGGYAADLGVGRDTARLNLACGLLLRAESNPDRHYYGTLGGLVRHVGDVRSDFTFWRLPLVASWQRQGEGAERRFHWSLLAGLLADGDERCVRVLWVPVWRKNR